MNPPVEPRRLVDEVRRLGIDAAAGVAHRFSQMVAPLDSGVEAGADRLAGDVVEALSAMLRVVQDLIGLTGIGGAPTADDRLTVDVAEPGTEGTAILWVHGVPGDGAPPMLAASDLVSPAGRIPSSAVVFHPPSPAPVTPGGGRPVMVRVRIHPGIRPGEYHGVVTGGQGAVLRLRVVVGPDR